MTLQLFGPSVESIKTHSERVAELGDTTRGRRRDEPFNPFAPGASQQARKRTEDRRKSESTDNATQSKPVMSIAERRRRSLSSKNKQKESKTAIDEKKETPNPVTQEIKLPQQPAQQKSTPTAPTLPDRRSQLEARTAASVETSKQVMEEKKIIESEQPSSTDEIVREETELTSENTEPTLIEKGPDIVALPDDTSKENRLMYFVKSKPRYPKPNLSRKVGGNLTKKVEEDKRKSKNWTEESISSTNIRHGISLNTSQ